MSFAIKAYVERQYSYGFQIVRDGEPLSKEDGVKFFMEEAAKIGNEFIPTLEWQENYNR